MSSIVKDPDIEVYLKLKSRVKGIPYPAVDCGDSINHGFKVLKANPTEAAKIAEVQDNEALKNALIQLNNISTPFFTIGCEKSYNAEENGSFVKGFLELAFNYQELVIDAQNYFKLFYDFNQFIEKQKCNLPVYYLWEIAPAFFNNANLGGFTITVWITSLFTPDMDKTKRIWEDAVNFLTSYLMTIPKMNGKTIY